MENKTSALNLAKNYTIIESLKKNDRQIAISGLNDVASSYKDSTDMKKLQIQKIIVLQDMLKKVINVVNIPI